MSDLVGNPEDCFSSVAAQFLFVIACCRYVKMRFEVTTPQFFVLVYNKLTNLNINGRNMSVKLPEQFEETLRGW